MTPWIDFMRASLFLAVYDADGILNGRHVGVGHLLLQRSTMLSGCSFYGCKIRSFSDFVFENIHSFYFSP